MVAAQAFQADICAKADYFPIERAAGVRLAQADDVIQLKVRQHEGHYNTQKLAPALNGIIFVQESYMLIFQDPSLIVTLIFVLIVSFTVHEFSHAWSATQLGDDTPRLNGRLTLNPLKHLDPIGSLMLLFVGFGWAKPVPINPYALSRRSSAGVMWVSLAGPASNLIMAIIAAVPFRLGLVSVSDAGNLIGKFLPSPAMFLYYFIYFNLVLMLFNLIPIAPLDGEKILEYFLPANWTRTFESIRPYGPMILMGLFVLGSFGGLNIIGALIGPPIRWLMGLLLGV